MMLARRFAQLLMCEAPGPAAAMPDEYQEAGTAWVDACGTCTACQLHAADAHPDCHHVHRHLNRFHPEERVRSRKGMDLGVDVIREFVIAAVGRTAQRRGAKVFLIEDAHLLTPAAQNALLKTLEEPPPRTHLVLVTRWLDRLLSTTRSRCQSVRCGGLPSQFIADRLPQLVETLDDASAGFLARHVPGSLGVAVELAQDGIPELNERMVEALLGLQRYGGLELAKRIEANAAELADQLKSRNEAASPSDLTRRAITTLLALAATFYRDVLLAACGETGRLCNGRGRDRIVSHARNWGDGRARAAIGHVVQAEADLGVNANPMLCLERMGIELARLSAI